MKTFINKIKSYIVAHKIISLVILVVILFLGSWVYGKITSTSGDSRYITAKVRKGDIIASVSGTGQISASSQLDLKPKVSGDIVYIGAVNGQKVAAWTLIAEIDPTDARKSVRDAEANLESAKLSLEKIKIQNSNVNLSADAKKAYNDGWNVVTAAFPDLNSTIDGLDTLLGQSNLSDNAARVSGKTAQTYLDKATKAYYDADSAFGKNKRDYGVLGSNSPASDVENILNKTYNTTKLLSDAIKYITDFTDYMANDSSNSAFTASQNTLASYTSTINGHLSSLLTALTNINDNKDSSQNASLDLQSAQLSVTQKENALQDAKDNLADYFIRAPYAGTVANMVIKKSDSVSGSTIIATLITDKQIAEISLNEVDVAKIKIGEKADLTFDAIPDLTISGIVEEIDPIGTVSQGVVTYNVKITLDKQDARIKSAMSVSSAIITDTKEGVLVVPNSAIKSQNGASYVEMFDAPLPPPTDGLIGFISKIAPKKVRVEIGLSNDSHTEIISGINEGEEIVVRTISPTATSAAAPSLFNNTPANRNNGGVRTTPR